MHKTHVQPPTVGDLKQLIQSDRWSDAACLIENLHPSDAATLFEQLPFRQQRTMFRLISSATAAALLPHLAYYDQFALLHARPRTEMREILNEMAGDDLMRLLEDLPENAWRELVGELADSKHELRGKLSAYPPNTAGRYATAGFLSLSPGMCVKDALEEIRKRGHNGETVDVMYVIDNNGRLVDEVRLSMLVMASPEQLVTTVDASALVVAKDTDRLEDVLALFEKYDRVALPVVDKDGKMLGILTVDDVMDVARSLATRDIQKMGGMEALDAPYLSVRLKQMLQKRGGWLALLFLGEMLTATAMSHFEHEIATAVVLALFVPLIISSGGNSGSQATSLLVRALALRELSVRDWWKVCAREIGIGVILGGFLGAIGFVRIVSWQWLHFTAYGPHYLLLAVTVWMSLIGVVGFGTIAGSMLPFILRRCGFDPATSSSPLVATLVDVAGLIIYFTVARVVLRGVLL